ncbi:MAG TPA: hypothetical protein VKW08_22665 [Xanthobacteraceae bacterium]|jgi:hypothetical protein|nr:hypothetical protein [Xanthobacteraceae bacterium]
MKKTISMITVAVLLGLGSGVAMAHDSGDNHQDDTNTTGYNPFMPEFSSPRPQGRSAFASAPLPQHVAPHHVKKQTPAPSARR